MDARNMEAMECDIDVKIATIVLTKIACLASPPQPMRSSKTSFSNSMSNHPLRNTMAKEPRNIVMLVGNTSKVSSTITLKRTWTCTLVVSTSRKNSKLVIQCANFAIELNGQKLRCGRTFLSVVSIIFMFLA
ncbi:hypothetical protein CFP56_031175 [Quercus suber]|uniref:Uncharacterized protein n=1 Tax=Quercus suber TaxID=58331 RepID=A0AAW0JK57_QUESU